MSGLVRGSVIHIHRARTVIIGSNGLITASELGNNIVECTIQILHTFQLLIRKASLFQAAVKVLGRETIQMELEVVPDTGEEGALDFSMGG